MPRQSKTKTPEENLVHELTKNNNATQVVEEPYTAYEVVNVFIVNGLSITGVIDITNDTEEIGKLLLYYPHFIEDGKLVPYELNSDAHILPINTGCIWSLVKTKSELAEELINKVIKDVEEDA